MLSPVVDSPSAVGSTAAGATHSSADRIVVEPVAGVIQDTIYVTVGACVKESKSHLLWTLHNSGGNRVCIIHVHQPAQKIPTMMGSFPASQLNHQVIRDYRQIERQKMQKILEEYLHICRQMGVLLLLLSSYISRIICGCKTLRFVFAKSRLHIRSMLPSFLIQITNDHFFIGSSRNITY
ncbi:PREDICTED: U-box domain-containing protein 33-like [Fragaria vesca subsp. vesca]